VGSTLFAEFVRMVERSNSGCSHELDRDSAFRWRADDASTDSKSAL
jgi:hypothetical protein